MKIEKCDMWGFITPRLHLTAAQQRMDPKTNIFLSGMRVCVWVCVWTLLITRNFELHDGCAFLETLNQLFELNLANVEMRVCEI